MSTGSKVMVVGLVAVAVAGAVAYYGQGGVADAPPRSAPADPEQAVMQIALESGTSVTVPYVMEDGILWTVADGPWWTDLRGDGDGVVVVLDGKPIPGRARAVEGDDALRGRLVAALRPDAPSSTAVPIEVKLAPWAFR